MERENIKHEVSVYFLLTPCMRFKNTVPSNVAALSGNRQEWKSRVSAWDLGADTDFVIQAT